jgi:hypothetical protein
MQSSQKLNRTRALLTRLLQAASPNDEVYFIPFTDLVGPFERLTATERRQPFAQTATSGSDGTALYDALAATLCNMRAARNTRQAVVVITDGADQHSRLLLDQVIHLAAASKPQIFMIGLFDPESERQRYKESGKTITLVNGHAADNPLNAFDRLAKESGAEAFFPSSEEDLGRALEQILGTLRSEYTLAYYPNNVRKIRRIRVRVNRRDVLLTARRTVGAADAEKNDVHFAAHSCIVSPAEHPYPWEAHITTRGLAHVVVYQENFSDPSSGWPNRPGSQYAAGAYEIEPDNDSEQKEIAASRRGVSVRMMGGHDAAGTIAAYGPVFENFRASLSVSGKWSTAFGAARQVDVLGAGGLVFRLNETGYYVLMVDATGSASHIKFKLAQRTWSLKESTIIPWTEAPPADARADSTSTVLGVTCKGGLIVVSINGTEAGRATDASFSRGQVGMAAFGLGRAVFRDLRVEEEP